MPVPTFFDIVDIKFTYIIIISLIFLVDYNIFNFIYIYSSDFANSLKIEILHPIVYIIIIISFLI